MARPPTRRPCIEPGCRALSLPGRSRCGDHQQTRDRADAGARNARRRAAPGDGAAARLRAQLNRAGAGTCGTCRRHLPAHHLRVDHRQALADGGTDTTPNCWLLCTTCHNDKTATENAARAQRRRDDAATS